MVKKASTVAELNELHRLVAKSFKQRFEADIADDVPTDAATLGAAIKFLKDNEITADPADKDDLTDLRDQFKAMAEKRRKPVLSVVEQAAQDITEDDFRIMQG